VDPFGIVTLARDGIELQDPGRLTSEHRPDDLLATRLGPLLVRRTFRHMTILAHFSIERAE
jgi:hypothetical protein